MTGATTFTTVLDETFFANDGFDMLDCLMMGDAMATTMIYMEMMVLGVTLGSSGRDATLKTAVEPRRRQFRQRSPAKPRGGRRCAVRDTGDHAWPRLAKLNGCATVTV